MIGSILTTDDLLKITGYEKPGDMRRKLIEQGIKVFSGKSGPWTTIELINAAGGLKVSTNDEYSTDIL